jgi:hypothetical protein
VQGIERRGAHDVGPAAAHPAPSESLGWWRASSPAASRCCSLIKALFVCAYTFEFFKKSADD